MKRRRVVLVFGTRPEAIKMAPVLSALRARADRFEPQVWLTGQHREMLDQVLEVFQITPDLDLELMRPDQSPAEIAAGALEKLAPRLAESPPDALLVQGDTITAFAAALAAFLGRVPVGHVEAGLRSGDRFRPFPEEVNRRLATVVTDFHFAPTAPARDNLLAEGVLDDRIVVTGNTVVDALLQTVRDGYAFEDSVLASLDWSRPVVLITMHRRESFGGPLRTAAEAMREIAQQRPEAQLVFPLHRNPRVRGPMQEILQDQAGVHLVDPLGYREFANLMARATLALTDSGGIQEEAPSLNLPVLVMRDVTERPEGIATGAARLVGTDRDSIVSGTLALLDDPEARQKMGEASNPYGDGRAAERIADALERFLA